jgi:flagellin-like hook-associated protein FlgL
MAAAIPLLTAALTVGASLYSINAQQSAMSKASAQQSTALAKQKADQDAVAAGQNKMRLGDSGGLLSYVDGSLKQLLGGAS